MIRIVLRILGAVVVLALLVAGWFLLMDGRAPAKRPDLVRLPDGLGPPPAGYPTENAVFLALTMNKAGLGGAELVDLEDVAELPAGVEVEQLGGSLTVTPPFQELPICRRTAGQIP